MGNVKTQWTAITLPQVKAAMRRRGFDGDVISYAIGQAERFGSKEVYRVLDGLGARVICQGAEEWDMEAETYPGAWEAERAAFDQTHPAMPQALAQEIGPDEDLEVIDDARTYDDIEFIDDVPMDWVTDLLPTAPVTFPSACKDHQADACPPVASYAEAVDTTQDWAGHRWTWARAELAMATDHYRDDACCAAGAHARSMMRAAWRNAG